MKDCRDLVLLHDVEDWEWGVIPEESRIQTPGGRAPPRVRQIAEDTNDVFWGRGPELGKDFWNYHLLAFTTASAICRPWLPVPLSSRLCFWASSLALPCSIRHRAARVSFQWPIWLATLAPHDSQGHKVKAKGGVAPLRARLKAMCLPELDLCGSESLPISHCLPFWLNFLARLT